MTKAIILAAGKSKRLRGFYEEPKCLLRIGNKSLLERHLEILDSCNINDIIIVVGWKAEAIASHLIVSKLFGNEGILYKFPRLVYCYDYNKTENLVSLFVAIKKIVDDEEYDDLIILNSDILFDKRDLEKLIKAHGILKLLVYRKKCDKEDMKVRGRLVNNSLIEITKISKKISPRLAIGEFMGISFISKYILPLLAKHLETLSDKSPNRYYEFAYDTLDILKTGVIARYPYLEIDTPKDYRKAISLKL